MKSEIRNPKSKIVIVGAGPSGASLAIRLARENFRVCLIEREQFPRQKLCGEFISPECLEHFRQLNVLDEMLECGGERIAETVFYEPKGKSISVPSEWLGGKNSAGALSLSRAAMDLRLLEEARQSGVEVLENAAATNILFEADKVCGVKIKSKNGATKEICADLTIDATGRANVLTKLAAKELSRRSVKQESNFIRNLSHKIRNPKSEIRNRLVGFKTHLTGVNLKKDVCEIYFFRGGYGGLSFVENAAANFCFLIEASVVKKYDSDVGQIIEKVVWQNRRAAETMADAQPIREWLAVAVDNFGLKNLTPAKNLLCVGDAAAFIDPFTGSGMLMALESAEILARTIADNQSSPERIAGNYQILHRRKFQNRLRVCALLRRAAFAPRLAGTLIGMLDASRTARQILARSTRQIVAANENK